MNLPKDKWGMLNMNYNDFLTRQQANRKTVYCGAENFYEQILKKKYDKTEVRILASFIMAAILSGR